MNKIVLSFLAFFFVFLTALDLFSIELGRGFILVYHPQSAGIVRLSDNKLIQADNDGSVMVDLITGESIPFESANLKIGTVVDYIIDGTKLISLSVDFGGIFGEYAVVGGMDFYNLSSQTCRVNGTRLKFDSQIKFRSRGKDVSPNIIRNTDLVRVTYKKDPVNDENIATIIEVISGTNFDMKRTGIIRKFSVNEIILGDPVDPNYQEQFIVHTSSKIYDNNFESGSRSLLKVGTLIDVYAMYDSILSTNIAYEIHVKDIPNNNDFSITGRPLSASAGFLTTEFGVFNFLPTGKFTDFSGDAITLTELLQGEARYFSANVVRGNEVNLTAIKEIPTVQTESTFEGTITILPSSPIAQGIRANSVNQGSSLVPQSLLINQTKTQFKGHYYNQLEGRTARITARKGSNANLRQRILAETMAIEATDPVNPKFFIGVITESSGSFITINDMKINLNSNTSFVKIDGTVGNITDFVPGNFAVIEVNPGTDIVAKTAYRFNQFEIVGRINYTQNDQISVGGNMLPTGDFTYYRGQGNQVTELDKILPNSVVKVVTLHGAAEAITKFTGKGFPTTATVGTIARIVYVLQGPDPVSTNDPVVTSTIFPNPSSTTVSIAAPENVVSEVTVSTMLGERVFSKANVTGTTQFSTATLPIGQYLVKITNNKSTTNQILQVIR
ncbi:MAG: T9SS type A sorting domain-containing protein [Candidatus Kapabacteria bacterium]|nr:T9SS type A sorting domain-containing protein [Candidatus Kapabacteria bacterium]